MKKLLAFIFSFGIICAAVPALSAPTTGVFPSSFSVVAPSPLPVVPSVGSSPFPTAQNKKTTILTNSALGINGTFTSPWVDTNLDGTSTVFTQAYSSGGLPNASNYYIQQTDDNSNINFTFTSSAATFIVNNGLTSIQSVISHRYWRVVYGPVNTTAQTSLEITATTTNALPSLSVVDPNSASPITIQTVNNDNIPTYLPGVISQALNVGFNASANTWERQQDDAGGTVRVANGGNAYKTYAGGSTALLVIKASAGRLDRIANLNTAAQTVTFSCYDNATTASGNLIFNQVLTAGQVVDMSWPVTAGITCISSAATLAGAGINVSYN